MFKYDAIVVGAGFAGATIAERLTKLGKKVLVIDKRDHLGGNSYDYDEEGILIHKYGPHIFHTNSKEVYDYLSQFTEWYDYEHRVLGHVLDKVVPIPFNFRSIDLCMPDKAEKLKRLLIRDYGEDKKVPIMELMTNEDPDIKELAAYIYENVFKHYTMKQWGLSIEELDNVVSSRVPVNTSYDDRYFTDRYQCMPKDGYTKMFEKMLEGIDVELNTESDNIIHLEDGKIYVEGEEYDGDIYYTGAIDELFNYSAGVLPYRSNNMVLSRELGTHQAVAVENYNCDKYEKAYTRVTEYKHFVRSGSEGYTYIHTEYPLQYNRYSDVSYIPCYPIFTEYNQRQYQKYVELSKQYKNLHLVGRLAEYKYYNMDEMVERVLELFK